MKHKFQTDFFIFDKILVEVKATPFIHIDNFRQTLNYLKASKEIKLGILINFGNNQLEFKRVILTQ